MSIPAPLRRPGRFLTHAGGASAIEFALIAPILIFFYFGMAEVCQLMMAQRRVSHSAAAMADLITQVPSVNATQVTDVFAAGTMILAPFPVQSLGVRVTSIRLDANKKPRVMWSSTSGTGFSPSVQCAELPVKTPITNPGESVVVAEVKYAYVSPIGYFLPGSTALSHRAELRPRTTNEVTRSDLAAAPC